MKKWKAKLHVMEQGTTEWLKVREGRITGSVAKTLLTPGLGKGLHTLIEKKAQEKVYGRDEKFFETYETNHGHEYESHARERFEFELDEKVKEVGFIELSEYVGCSPDGVLDDGVVIEIKCFQKKHHLEVISLAEDGKIESDIEAQIQFNLMCTGGAYGWFIAYYPPFLDVEDDKQFAIVKVERDEALIGYMRAKVEVASDMIEARALEIVKTRAIEDAVDSTTEVMF